MNTNERWISFHGFHVQFLKLALKTTSSREEERCEYVTNTFSHQNKANVKSFVIVVGADQDPAVFSLLRHMRCPRVDNRKVRLFNFYFTYITLIRIYLRYNFVNHEIQQSFNYHFNVRYVICVCMGRTILKIFYVMSP